MAVEGVDDLLVLEGFTLRESGEALGKSLLTIRSWIGNGIIPEPFCEEAATGYQQFTRFELEVLASILAEHEEHSSYVSTQDADLIDEIWRAFQEVRGGFLDAEVA